MARALYEKGPKEAELATFGLVLTDLEDTTVGVWPENETALYAFDAMFSQWRIGMNGPTGLDYNALPVVLRMQSIPRKDWPDTFECVRVMEAEAMKVMSEQHD